MHCYGLLRGPPSGPSRGGVFTYTGPLRSVLVTDANASLSRAALIIGLSKEPYFTRSFVLGLLQVDGTHKKGTMPGQAIIQAAYVQTYDDEQEKNNRNGLDAPLPGLTLKTHILFAFSKVSGARKARSTFVPKLCSTWTDVRRCLSSCDPQQLIFHFVEYFLA